jgi:hypothetical protein
MNPQIRIPKRARVAEHFGGWTLFELAPSDSQSFLWQGVKLAAPPDTRKRRGALRAFWLTWSPLALRFARRREFLRLQTEQPGLCAELELFMSRTYDRAWLLREGGVTDAEIDAEVGRLALARSLAVARRKAGAL